MVFKPDGQSTSDETPAIGRNGPARQRRSTGRRLTPKQERFALEYLKDFNATQAAVRAGYSRKNADVYGPALLGNLGIAAFIEERRRVIFAALEAEVTDVIRQLTAVATSDLAQAFDLRGRLRSVHAMPEQFRRAVASLKVSRDGQVIEIKLWDKNRALELLARHLGMFVDRTEVGAPGEFAHMTREELDAELEALRARQAARAKP